MRIKILCAALVLVLLCTAAYFFLRRPAVQFDGERTVSADPPAFSLRFKTMNTSDAQTLSLREGDTLAVSWQIESGEMDVVITPAGGAPLYKADHRGGGDAAAFDLIIPQTGEYTVSVSGRQARGWLQCTVKEAVK